MIRKKETIIHKIARGEYPEHEVKTKYGSFKLRMPSGEEEQFISILEARMRNNSDRKLFSDQQNAANRINSVLSIVIFDYPDEENYPKEFHGQGIVNFPDWEVKNALYEAFSTFLQDICTQI